MELGNTTLDSPSFSYLVQETRIKNKKARRKIKKLLYDSAQFRNLLLLFQSEYKHINGHYLLDQSLIYSLLARKTSTRTLSNHEKQAKISAILSESSLKTRIENLRDQKELISNTHVVQTIIRQVIKELTSYFKAVKEYREPAKFRGKPRAPRPRTLKSLRFSAIQLDRRDFKRLEADCLLVKTRLGTPQESFKLKLPSSLRAVDISSLRLNMVGTDIYLQLVYKHVDRRNKDHEKTQQGEQAHVAGIDLGLDPLMAISSTNPRLPGLLISGRELKSYTQWYNKKKARLQALVATINDESEKKAYRVQLKRLEAYRYRRLTSDLHKLSSKLVDLLSSTGHQGVFIGKNAISSKQGIRLGKKVNQTFVGLPFRRLVELVRYKLAKRGISLQEVEESYTSQVSAWSGSILRVQEERKKDKSNVVDFGGRRIKRGLSKDTPLKKVLHADLNAALNILKVGTGIERLPFSLKLFLKKTCNPVRLSFNSLVYGTLVHVSGESVCLVFENPRIAGSSVLLLLSSPRSRDRGYLSREPPHRGSDGGGGIGEARVDGFPHSLASPTEKREKLVPHLTSLESR